MAKTATREQTIERVLSRWKLWADQHISRYGRGYYPRHSTALTYGEGHEDGFRYLQEITEPRGPYDGKIELLDDLLAARPLGWSVEHRTLLAGSIIRYMAELD